MTPLPRPLLWCASGLALAVIVLGAYVRLSDAGLGCPDWPGCYGQATPWHAAQKIGSAHAAAPDGPVSPAKAWKEMLHRYLAGALGLAILAIALQAWRRLPVRERVVPGVLPAVVSFQALLGMWTVTLQLKPVVVAAHLLGGMVTLALLVWLCASVGGSAHPSHGKLRRPARLLLIMLLAQIALGGWVSANDAAPACPDLPTCQGRWWPAADFATAFSFGHSVGEMPMDALAAIHLAHRLGALAVMSFGLWLGWRVWSTPGLKGLGGTILILLGVQFLIGLGNVLMALPLPLAVAHNAGAALLLATLVAINARIHGGPV